MLWDMLEILDVIQLTYVYFACSDNGQLYLRVLSLLLSRRSPSRFKSWLPLGTKTKKSVYMKASPEVQLYSVSATPNIQGWYKDVPHIPLKVSQEEGVWSLLRICCKNNQL